MIYSHIYTSTYEVRVQMTLTEHVLVHILDENNDKFIKRMVQCYMVNLRENDILSYVSQ